MEIFKEAIGHEQLVFLNDKDSGLKAIIGIHDTTLGTALGGTRVWPYKSEQEAITDVLRLSRGMTYKASISGLNLGGAKAVIIADPKDTNEALFRAFGKYVDALDGRYITAEDVNTSVQNMDWINLETNYVTGTSGIFGSGNPSPFTAYGIFLSMKAAVEFKLQKKSLSGLRIAVQGLGNVASNLCAYMHKEGAKLIVTDLSPEKCQMAKDKWNAEVVGLDEIFSVDCDVFSPNALGAIINDNTIDKIKAKIIVGGANNQLLLPEHGDILHKKGVLYGPDYLVNSGGLMNVYQEIIGYSSDQARKRVSKLYDLSLNLYKNSEKESTPTYKMADIIAERRLESIRKIKKIHTSSTKSAADIINKPRVASVINENIFSDLK